MGLSVSQGKRRFRPPQHHHRRHPPSHHHHHHHHQPINTSHQFLSPSPPSPAPPPLESNYTGGDVADRCIRQVSLRSTGGGGVAPGLLLCQLTLEPTWTPPTWPPRWMPANTGEVKDRSLLVFKEREHVGSGGTFQVRWRLVDWSLC